MTSGSSPPGVFEEERARKVRLLSSVLRAMVVMGAIALVAALIDARNDLRVTLGFYLGVFSGIFWLWRAARNGRVEAAAWSVSLFFWVLVAFVTLFFNGLQGENAAAFGVCTMLAGSLVGGRAAVAVAVLSSAWCALIAALEMRGALPAPLGHYSPVNSWSAITVTLIMISVLLRNSMDSMRAMHARAQESAAQRDEALRRSIQAQKMELVGNLASGVAHDFNNLLLVIANVSESLREELGTTRTVATTQLDELDAATSRAVLLTRQLLSFGRNQPNELTRIDLGEVVRAFGPMLPRLIGSHIKVDLRVDADAFVMASRVGVEQVLLNLAVNARDAMPDGGRLELRVRALDDVRLTVTDSGVGMDADTQARIFTPFFSTKATGTGLGLATVHETVSRFGGTIRVESEPGRGSTFEFCFARADQHLADA
jgi:signal transduction histidine kinase